jgi:hypothetical protein
MFYCYRLKITHQNRNGYDYDEMMPTFCHEHSLGEKYGILTFETSRRKSFGNKGHISEFSISRDAMALVSTFSLQNNDKGQAVE